MESSSDSPEAIAAVDALLASVGLEHGRRTSLAGSWHGGERVRRPREVASDARTPETPAPSQTPGVERVPGWSGLKWLCAGFSTREGGRSRVYSDGESVGDQNLGWTAEDDPAIIGAAREHFVQNVCEQEANVELVTTRQFHSGMITTVLADHGPLRLEGSRSALRGDGLMTNVPGLLLGVLTADCVPVLVADTRTHAVAAFHAGWRGTLARIVERGIGSMRLRFGSEPDDLVAAIGPSIRACCFAVGDEVRSEFESQFAYTPTLFSDVYDADPVREKYPLLFLTARAPGHSNLGPQRHLDLAEANRRQLVDAGVRSEAIQIIAECTACTRLRSGRRKYFSHRAEHGFTGRMLSVIGALGS